MNTDLERFIEIGLGDDDDSSENELNMDVDVSDEPFPRSLDKLIETYSYSMSPRDVKLLGEIQRREPSLKCLLFKLLDKQATTIDSEQSTLNKQAKITDFISLKLNEQALVQSVLNFPLARKLDDLSNYTVDQAKSHSNVYDPIYILPNVYNLFDYGT